MDVVAWWMAWCAVRDVDPAHASIADLRDLALDLHLAGVEHAAAASGWWGTSGWATLRLSLPA